ncbi:MAG: cysteine desulfurase family protein, partial [Bdellovibrionales bacterium]
MTSKPLPIPIYMDHNATTPVDPAVKAAMDPFLAEQFGNASSSSHAYGWQAQIAVRKAREQVATLIGCEPAQVIWTSGATESNNLAILGLVRAFRGEKPHIITQATEHKAVIEVCEAAEEWGADVTILGVDSDGFIRLDELEKAITPRTVLISIMMANNEIGTLQPVDKIAAICKERKIVFHSDAAQSVGKCAFDLKALP